jgi:hypothetical protein
MENEKMQVNFAPGVTEATLRVIELHEENELPHASPFFFSLQVESSTLHTLHGGRYYKESFCSCKMPLL